MFCACIYHYNIYIYDCVCVCVCMYIYIHIIYIYIHVCVCLSIIYLVAYLYVCVCGMNGTWMIRTVLGPKDIATATWFCQVSILLPNWFRHLSSLEDCSNSSFESFWCGCEFKQCCPALTKSYWSSFLHVFACVCMCLQLWLFTPSLSLNYPLYITIQLYRTPVN